MNYNTTSLVEDLDIRVNDLVKNRSVFERSRQGRLRNRDGAFQVFLSFRGLLPYPFFPRLALLIRSCGTYIDIHSDTDTLVHNTQHNTTQYSTTQYSTAQYSTAQHNTAQHNTAQHNTTRHDTTRHDTTRHQKKNVRQWPRAPSLRPSKITSIDGARRPSSFPVSVSVSVPPIATRGTIAPLGRLREHVECDSAEEMNGTRGEREACIPSYTSSHLHPIHRKQRHTFDTHLNTNTMERSNKNNN